MKIAILSPSLPPARCGVGDHSAKLARAWVEQGDEVHVFTSSSSAVKTPGICLHQVDFGSESFLEILRALELDAIFVQFTPYLWSKNKLRAPFQLLKLLRRIRKDRRPAINLIAHELYYPVEVSTRGITIGFSQRILFFKISSLVDEVYFTYAAARTNAAKRQASLADRSMSLPVGSNVDMNSNPPEPKEGEYLLHFGGAHPTHLIDWVIEAFRRAKVFQPDLKLALVGLRDSALAEHLKRLEKDALADSIIALGYLSEAEVSRWMMHAKVVLAPFLDGISTRRGSAMAAFQHGRPVVSTLGWASDREIPWSDFVRVEASDDLNAYCEAVIEILESPLQAEDLGKRAKLYYAEHFSWPVITQKMQNRLIQWCENGKRS